LRRGTSTRVPHVLERKARAQNASENVSVGTKKRERERKRDRVLLLLFLFGEREEVYSLTGRRRRRRSGTKLCLRLEFWPLGKRISLISRSVAFTAYVETEKAEREDEKPTLSTKR